LHLSKLATLYASKIGDDALNDLLRSLFGKEPPKTPASYDVIKRHEEFNPIITTNFDNGLSSYLGIPATFDYRYFTERYNPSNGGRVLLHLHGHAHWLKSHRVITAADYASFYRMPDVNNLVHEIVTLIQTRTLIFVGYGVADENVIRLLALLQQVRSQQFTAWLVSPDALRVADENQSLGINFRPIPLRSSAFFTAYTDIIAGARRRLPRSPFRRQIRMESKRVDVLLTGLLDILDNGGVAEELLTAILDGKTTEPKIIEIEVSPGNRSLMIVPQTEGGSLRAFTVEYDGTVIPFDLASGKTAAQKLFAKLPRGCTFGLASPISAPPEGDLKT